MLPVPDDVFRLRLHEAVSLYVGAMGYDRSITDARVRAWSDARREPGWAAVVAVHHPADMAPADALRDVGCPLAGVAYCVRGRSTQWWHVQVRGGMAEQRWPVRAVSDMLGDYVELAEIHVHPGHQGARLGERLLRGLMAGRPESRVLLSTPEVPDEDNRAWRLYRRLGFTDVLRQFHFAGDSRPFAVLGASLPLLSDAAEPASPDEGGAP